MAQEKKKEVLGADAVDACVDDDVGHDCGLIDDAWGDDSQQQDRWRGARPQRRGPRQGQSAWQRGCGAVHEK